MPRRLNPVLLAALGVLALLFGALLQHGTAAQAASSSTNSAVQASSRSLPAGVATPCAAAQLPGRTQVQLYNNSTSTTLYIGDSAISSSTGFPVATSTASPVYELGYNAATAQGTLYCLVSATSTVNLIEIR